jgi:hypothetical protein
MDVHALDGGDMPAQATRVARLHTAASALRPWREAALPPCLWALEDVVTFRAFGAIFPSWYLSAHAFPVSNAALRGISRAALRQTVVAAGGAATLGHIFDGGAVARGDDKRRATWRLGERRATWRQNNRCRQTNGVWRFFEQRRETVAWCW